MTRRGRRHRRSSGSATIRPTACAGSWSGCRGASATGSSSSKGCIPFAATWRRSSKSLAGIGGVCVSDHPELRALHFLARAYVFTASGSPSNVASVAAAVRVIRQHPELRERLWTNIRALRRGLRDVGYAIGESESPIVPILIGDEERTIALWQGLLTAGLFVNLIVPPGCPKDDCVLRASCSAAHTPDQIDRALEIFARARSRSAESLALQRGHTVARAF